MQWWNWLKETFNHYYAGIANRFRSPFDHLSQYGNKNHPDQEKLTTLRNKHYDLIQQASESMQPDYNKITKLITQDTKEYINQIIQEEEKKLGPPPCEYSVFTLGSMARQESGPVTDLEIGFLVEERNVKNTKYFYQLSQNISDRLFLLGEHPDIGNKGLRMDEANNAPPHRRFFARNLSIAEMKNLVSEAVMNAEWDKMPFEGSRPFLATPQEFASFTRSDYKQDPVKMKQIKQRAMKKEWENFIKVPEHQTLLKTRSGRIQLKNEFQFWMDQVYRPYNIRELRTANDAGKKLGRNIEHLYGNKQIYNEFYHIREGYLRKNTKDSLSFRHSLAKNAIKGDILKILQKGEGIYITGELGETLDIKRELYRLPEQFITNLGFYYQCKTQNTIDIVNELIERNVLNPEFGNQLIDYMQFSTGLRLKEQSVLKRQGFAAYFDQTKFDKDKAETEKKLTALKNTIEFMEKSHIDLDQLSAKKRELVKLESSYKHLLEMAPGKIYSAQDVHLLKTKYAPLAKTIFEASMHWSQDHHALSLPLPKENTKQPEVFLPAFKTRNETKRCDGGIIYRMRQEQKRKAAAPSA